MNTDGLYDPPDYPAPQPNVQAFRTIECECGHKIHRREWFYLHQHTVLPYRRGRTTISKCYTSIDCRHCLENWS